ncbi:hypothetical protein JCM10908_000823 [Rhodotorula pacifica]|uniref:Stu2p n=1 Tax=Rhodotorula pacifica TaxID=1495444 RepID=UPI003177F93C
MDGAAPDDNIDALPLEQRLSHKVWKARLSAYTEIASLASKTVDESDPLFREHYTAGQSLRDWVRDANAVAQEKGVEAACAIVEFGGRAAARSRADVVPSVVEKCLGSARAGTRTKGIELCMLYIESEEDMAEGVVGDVVPGLDAKQPKVVAGAVMVLKEAVRCFGPKSVNVKPILKTLPKIFAHADKTVRSEGQLLCLALHSYLGPALTPHLGELKPVQQKELGEAFEAADRGERGDDYGFGKIRPSRYTASQKKEMARQEAQGQLEASGEVDGDEAAAEDEAAADEPEAAMDPYDLADPIPVLSRLPEDFYSNLSSSKWKDRKELALEPLLVTLSSSLRYQPDNYADLVAALAGRMSDANVLCVVLAAQCIEKLARGLRSDFARYKGAVTAPILGKLKEKKQNVQDALGAALDAIAASTSIGDFTEDVTTFAKDKNPSIKAATLSFYTRCLSSTTTLPPKGDLPDLIEAMKKALEDPDAGVRAAAADALGTLLKVVGERAFNALAGDMDPLRKEKVTEAAEKAVTKCKNGIAPGGGAGSAGINGGGRAPAAVPSRAAPPAAAASKPRPRPPPPSNKENAPPPRASAFDEQPTPPTPKPAARGPPARLLSQKPGPPAASRPPPPAATPVAAAAKKPAPSRTAPAPGPATKSAEPLRFRHTQEAAESLVDDGEVFPAEIVAQLNDANWKQRLEGMEKLAEWVKLDGRDADEEVVVRYLTGKKPGPKESNFQVAGKVFALLSQLAADSPTWSKAPMAVSIPVLCDKLGDIKLKKPASDALTAFAEKSSLGFVLSQSYETMSKQKAPKTLAESYVFVEQALRDFGLAGGLAVRDLIEFVKVGLKHSNAAVRTAATKTIVTLRLFVGADIVNFLSDLTPQLLSTIESEFAKVASEAPPEPTRFGADTVVAAPPASAGPAKAGKAAAAAGGGVAEVDPLDELFPRVDFDRLIPSAQIQALNDSAWKIRKEAIEGIRDTLDANKRIKPTSLPDLATPLKLRITDANKIIQLVALDVVARLASGMGVPFGQNLARIFAGPVAQVLSDQKANIRAAGVSTLTAMADASGLEGLVGSFDKPLEGNNPVQRRELTAWLEARLADPDAHAGLDLSGLAPGLLACLEDKQTEVRKSATALLPIIIANAGYGVVADALAKLKPASRSTASPIVESARSAASALGAKPATQPAAPQPSRPASSAAVSRAPVPAASRAPAPSSVRAAATSEAAPQAAPASAAPAPAAAAPPPRIPLGLSRPAAKPLRTAAAGPPLGDDAAIPSRLGQPRPRQSISGLRSAASSSRPMSSASNVSSAASSREAPFRSADPNQKLLRHKKETGAMKWVIEGTPRQDQVDWLATQMAPQISASLHAQLFSTDHSAERDFLAGLSVMDDCARDPATAGEACDLSEEEMRDRLVANFDLIVKYMTLRLALTSTVITVKCLDLADHLIPVLSKAEYRASDYEALPLLVSLVNKVGDSKETIRQRVRAIFKTICSVYPFSKVFSTIFEHGIDNKNARVRSECIEELGQLYSRHGAKIYPISQALPKIASNIGKPDATTRTAALHAIGAVYTLVGPDATWKAVGSLPAKDRSMLEERLKRTASGVASPMPPARTTAHVADGPPGTPGGGLRPPSSRLAAPASPSPANGTSALPSRAGIPRPGGIPSRLARPQSGVPPPASTVVRSNMPPPSRPIGAAGSRLAARPPAASAAFTEDDLMTETVSDIPSLIEALDTDDFNACSDVLKLVTREITKNTEQVLLHADALIDAVTARMELGFTDLAAETSPAQLRLCKHLMQVLSAFFDKRTLSQQVSRLPLTGLLADLTGRLLDTADNPVSEPIQSLSKVLNMVLIRIFHNADQNVCFGALLTVLQDATIDLRELTTEELADRAKYAELVMKCLWKVSKTVKESLEGQQLRAPRLLSDINQFLITIPPAEWRRRATDNVPLADMPLRTVKTILQQVVSVMKEKVFNELDEIDQAENSFVYQYLYRLANQLSGGETALRAEALARKASASSLGSAKREETAASSQASAESSPQATAGATAPPASSPGGTDIAVNQRLKEIFDLIGDPSHSRAGIAALYEFQKDHPEASARIATWMAGTGSYFQTYLKRALANLEAADRERTLEMPLDGSPEQPTSRPSSSTSRPSSIVPGTPTRSSRGSLNPSVTATPKLQELRSMFGLTDKDKE